MDSTWFGFLRGFEKARIRKYGKIDVIVKISQSLHFIGDSCHNRCTRATIGVLGINKIYILNPTTEVKLLQYSGSRVEHRDVSSSYKLIFSESKW